MGGDDGAATADEEIKKEEKPKVFCGFTRLYVVDSDGLQQKTNGSCINAPLHLRRTGDDEKSGDFVYTAHLPPKDPIHYLKIVNDPACFLCGSTWMGPCGKHDEPPDTNRLLVVVEAIPCSMLDFEASSCTIWGHIPFLANTYETKIPITLTLRSERFTCRVTSMSFKLSPELHEQWTKYVEALRSFDKENKDGDKKGDEKKKEG